MTSVARLRPAARLRELDLRDNRWAGPAGSESARWAIAPVFSGPTRAPPTHPNMSADIQPLSSPQYRGRIRTDRTTHLRVRTAAVV